MTYLPGQSAGFSVEYMDAMMADDDDHPPIHFKAGVPPTWSEQWLAAAEVRFDSSGRSSAATSDIAEHLQNAGYSTDSMWS